MGIKALQELSLQERILRYLRFIIEPLFVFHGMWPYNNIEGDEFRARIVNWREPTIDSTLYRNAILRELNTSGEFRADAKYIDKILSVVLDHYDSQIGAFRQCYSVEPSIYASSMAIGLIKQLEGVDWFKEPLGRVKAEQMLGNRGEEIITNLIEYVDGCLHEDGGFAESQNIITDKRSSIRTSNAAYFLLWNLDAHDTVIGGLFSFLESCVVETHRGRGLGFARKRDGKPSSGATYYALKMYKHMGMTNRINEIKEQVTYFLLKCWDEKENCAGFAPVPGGEKNLANTVYVLRVFEEIFGGIGNNLSDEYIDKLVFYFKECQSMTGGLKFHDRPGWEDAGQRWYSPNLYMTLHSIELINRLPSARKSLWEPVVEKVRLYGESYLSEIEPGLTRGYEKPVVPEVWERRLDRFREIMDAVFYPHHIPLLKSAVPFLVLILSSLLILALIRYLSLNGIVSDSGLIIFFVAPIIWLAGGAISLIRGIFLRA